MITTHMHFVWSSNTLVVPRTMLVTLCRTTHSSLLPLFCDAQALTACGTMCTAMSCWSCCQGVWRKLTAQQTKLQSWHAVTQQMRSSPVPTRQRPGHRGEALSRFGQEGPGRGCVVLTAGPRGANGGPKREGCSMHHPSSAHRDRADVAAAAVTSVWHYMQLCCSGWPPLCPRCHQVFWRS